MKFMGTIVNVLYKKFFSFLYLFLILLIFLLMYALVGEQLYAGKTNANLGYRENFDTFYFAFLAVFQLLTITNWTDLQILTLNTEVYRGVTVLFLISWIIIGSYIFLNLFIGILINGFVMESAIEMNDEEAEMLEKKEAEEKAEREQLLKLKENYSNDNLIDGLVAIKSRGKNPFDGIECNESLFFFSKKMKFRKVIHRVATSNIFENFILIVIVFSSIKLALDTYDLFGTSSMPIDWMMNVLFILEATFKIISNGLIMDSGSYLRNGWNILDCIIVIISIIDMALVNMDLSFQKVHQFYLFF